MRSSQVCVVDDCNKLVVAKSLCQFHYDRKRRYGDIYTRPTHLNCQDCRNTFSVRATGSLPTVCDTCFADRHRKRQKSDRRRKGLWEKYKLTLAEYQAMHDAQGGVCLICGNKEVGRGKKNNQLAVDHNHETGKIRGLLCTNCNTGIGNLKDSVSILYKAIQYLQERN